MAIAQRPGVIEIAAEDGEFDQPLRHLGAL
jgi:hypothetical protein